MNDLPKYSHLLPKWKGVHSFQTGIGFVLIGLLIWFLMATLSVSIASDQKNDQVQQSDAQPKLSPAAGPQAVPETPAGPAADLKNQLKQVLSGIKEANQKKDLSQLLSYYSPNFPQLPQRAQSISKDWKVCDYPKMDFEIKEVRLLDDNTALVTVTWNVETRNISTKKIKNVSKTYLTRFVKESGQWRIKALDKN